MKYLRMRGAFELSNYERADYDSLGFFPNEGHPFNRYVGKQLSVTKDFLSSCKIKVLCEAENPRNIILVEHRT